MSDPAGWVARQAHALAKAAVRHEAKRLGRAVPPVRMEIDARSLGAGYGHATDAGRLALALAAEAGLVLDLTYTAKTFAAVLDRRKNGTEENLLYWHTLSRAPMQPWLANAPTEADLSPSFRALLK